MVRGKVGKSRDASPRRPVFLRTAHVRKFSFTGGIVMRRFIVVASLAVVAFLTAPQSKADGVFTATLLGSNETPPNASTATGFITVTLTGNTLSVAESFSGLIGGAGSAAHIHCCAGSGVAAVVAVPFPGFPAATSGTFNQSFDLTNAASYNGAFITANGGTAASAESAFIAALFAGQTYANIHDSTFPAGEIRGQLIQTPEASTLAFLSMGLGLLGMWKRRRVGLNN
jgi:hypothetical protein